MEGSTLSPLENSTDYDYDFVFDDYNQHIVVAAALLLAAILGIFGNSLVIFSVFASKKLRNVTNAFVVNLAVADLVTSLMIPWNAAILLSRKEYPIENVGCVIIAGLLFTCVGTSLYTLASIAVNRLMLVTRPLRTYNIVYSPLYTGIWIAATWVISFCFNIVPPLADIGRLGTSQKYRMCATESSHPDKDTFDYIQSLGCFPVPLLTLIICYTLIYLHLRRHSKQLIQHEYRPPSYDVGDTVIVSEFSSGTLPSNCGTLQSKTGTLQNNSDTLQIKLDTLPSNSGTLNSNSGSFKGKDSLLSHHSDTLAQNNANNNEGTSRDSRNIRFSTENSNAVVSRRGKSATSTADRRQSLTEISLRKRENTITKNMFMIFIAFVICIVPFSLTLFINDSAPIVPYASALILMNACINPILYGFKHPYFKQVFKCLITCRWKEVPEQSEAFKRLRNICCLASFGYYV